jgi:CSLREA domain-containing protein
MPENPALICLLLFCFISAPASATIIQVNTIVDEINNDGDCSLREAIEAANTDTAVDQCPAGSGADRLVLQSSAIYQVSISGRLEDDNQTGDFDIASEIEVYGGTNTQISGNLLDRVFHIKSGAVAILRNLRIADGKPDSNGGGVMNQGTMTMDNCIVVNNQATAGGGIQSNGMTEIYKSTIVNNSSTGGGGGIRHSPGDRLVLHDSTVSRNQAGSGGGLYVTGLDMLRSTVDRNYAATDGGGIYKVSGTVWDSIVNSTLSGNRSDADGGGLWVDDFNRLHIASSTITANEADSDGASGGNGGGIYVREGNVIVKLANTIIARNEDNSAGMFAVYIPDCYGNVESLGYNLFGALNPAGAGCKISGPATGDLVGLVGNVLDPALNGLANNGGPTLTHALLGQSPAIDSGDPAGCADKNGAVLLSDQRLHERIHDGPDQNLVARCDIGAYEYGAPLANTIFISGFE